MKILFSGGGTLGPVTPLLAIAETVRTQHPDTKFVWVGTKTGPERALVEQAGIRFLTIASGKFRRYMTVFHITDMTRIVIGCFQSVAILWKENPDLCISAGGFVSVPVHLTAWLLGVPTWIHQQDVLPGLANKIMAPFAKQITTALESQLQFFSKKKTVWLGNPIRKDVLSGDRMRAKDRFRLVTDAPVLFATGGGTGSERVNQLVVEAVPHLQGFCHVIHLSGRERPQHLIDYANKHFLYYQGYQFFSSEMKDAYAVGDLIISRGGFGTLSEIAALKKAAIIIPKPGHQEENVQFLASAGAIVHIDERTTDGNYIAKIIKELILDRDKRQQMGEKLYEIFPRAKDEKILSIIERLTESKP